MSCPSPAQGRSNGPLSNTGLSRGKLYSDRDLVMKMIVTWIPLPAGEHSLSEDGPNRLKLPIRIRQATSKMAVPIIRIQAHQIMSDQQYNPFLTPILPTTVPMLTTLDMLRTHFKNLAVAVLDYLPEVALKFNTAHLL